VTQRELRRLVDAAEPKVRAQVERALKALQEAVPESTLEQIIRTRDVFAIHDLAGSLPARLAATVMALDALVTAGAKAGWQVAISERVSAVMRFDAVNAYAVRAARENGARLVTAVTRETRESIRAVVARSYTEGIPPREAARLIRPLIGLTERQATAVASLRADLIASGASRRQALSDARKYAEHLRRSRALMIARTEVVRASTAGTLASWDAAVKGGLLSPRSRKVWIVTDDDRLCRFCLGMDGKTAMVGNDFIGGRFGKVSGPPLHPNCRCAIGIESVPVERRRRAA